MRERLKEVTAQAAAERSEAEHIIRCAQSDFEALQNELAAARDAHQQETRQAAKREAILTEALQTAAVDAEAASSMERQLRWAEQRARIRSMSASPSRVMPPPPGLPRAPRPMVSEGEPRPPMPTQRDDRSDGRTLPTGSAIGQPPTTNGQVLQQQFVEVPIAGVGAAHNVRPPGFTRPQVVSFPPRSWRRFGPSPPSGSNASRSRPCRILE
jgi:hypothetical protein